jgi:hypothetical protein
MLYSNSSLLNKYSIEDIYHGGNESEGAKQMRKMSMFNKKVGETNDNKKSLAYKVITTIN